MTLVMFPSSATRDTRIPASGLSHRFAGLPLPHEGPATDRIPSALASLHRRDAAPRGTSPIPMHRHPRSRSTMMRSNSCRRSTTTPNDACTATRATVRCSPLRGPSARRRSSRSHTATRDSHARTSIPLTLCVSTRLLDLNGRDSADADARRKRSALARSRRSSSGSCWAHSASGESSSARGCVSGDGEARDGSTRRTDA
jgi:hypothetical protein